MQGRPGAVAVRRVLTALLTAACCVSAALLVVRALAGPSRLVHSPINAECALAICLLLRLLARLRPAARPCPETKPARWGMLLVVLATLAAYWPVLDMPLITDDYIHIRQIATGEAPTPLGCLTNSCGGPRFFRPLGFSTYWAEWELWGAAPLPRHALDLALAAASSLLFFLLARAVGLPPPFDLLAGLLFAFNALHPETVAWPAARFDAMAVFFSLLAALGALRRSGLALAVSVAATAAACLSKESAFVLPNLLAILLAPRWREPSARRRVGATFAAAVFVFAWRWWVLGGIGGYLTNNIGAPTVLSFHPLTIVKAFLWRIWGVLWFPLNWSVGLEWWAAVAVAAAIAASLVLLVSRPDRRLPLALLAVIVACVPVHHMILIGPSLERSRYLMYASAPFVLALAFAFRGLPRRTAIASLGMLVAFHAAGSAHNLRLWSSVSIERYELCRRVAGLAHTSPAPIAITDLPLTLDGVYWSNGLEDCLYLDFGVPMGKVVVNPVVVPATALHLTWDTGTRSLQPN